MVNKSIRAGQVKSTRELVDTLSDEYSTTRRHVTRLVNSFFGQASVVSLDEVTNANGRPLIGAVRDVLSNHLRSRRMKLLIGQLVLVDGDSFVLAVDGRGDRWWAKVADHSPETIVNACVIVRNAIGRDIALVPHAKLHRLLRHDNAPAGVTVVDWAHYPLEYSPPTPTSPPASRDRGHLATLEAESIRIIRETVAVAKRPGMLFSMGKDSMVMWTLAKKAFWPEPPPFPLVVIDTQWKFQDMYEFRHYMAARPDTNLIVHINPDAIRDNVNPFDFGSAVHTDITKTQALKQILDNHQFDYVLGGARRDEEKSRAKERIFSLRDSKHGWDPKNQRPELWNLYNTRILPGQSMRVFPLSNWTEPDIWRYINAEGIELVPLYFSKVRPFVERDGSLIMVDDDRFPLREGEKIHFEPIRFRTLGCYPLTGGVRSSATTVDQIIHELDTTRVSERSSRVIDFDPGASMEQKKKEGYF